MYIIQEIQTTGDQTALVTPETRTDLNEALSVFHQKASYAAVSAVETHTVMLHDHRGDVMEKLVFDHSEPEPEPTE